MYRATKVTLTGHSSVRMLNRELLAKAYAGRAEILIAMNKVLLFPALGNNLLTWK